ncbi:hypothetical protein [Arthrobacter bambusae]|uniref:hypothetical protein n=1 Tax=Arthrobacter bambusae TaxID=1338426 RepID=UPI002786ACCB|nr:hypothetical protein [Arthrobacter bambusae]MDQ0211912.1 hypothetical protein [Arthrobacter bambusae]MDQ0236478.1 hypothetical protein [Arthrobacter bambusae]
MKHPRTVAAVAVLFGLALAGCQTAAGPLPVDSSTTAVPSPSSSELLAIIQTAVEDRNATVLDNPPAPRLVEGETTAAYRAKRARDLPVVARSKAGFKSKGFWYTDFSTKIMVESVEVGGSTASVHFKELTEEHQASAANGPSNVPSGYSVSQTAMFLASVDGWQLDSIAPSTPGGLLPMSIVKG